MFAQRIDVDTFEDVREFTVRQHPVMNTFRHARGEAAFVFDKK